MGCSAFANSSLAENQAATYFRETTDKITSTNLVLT